MIDTLRMRSTRGLRRQLPEHVVQPARRVPALQFSRRRVRHHAPGRDDDRARAHGVDLLEDMRRDHDRLLRRHLRDQRAHLVLLVGIEPVGRLVEHQHRRVVQQRLRQADAALEALRQCLHRLQQHAFEPRQRPPRGRRAVPAPAGVAAHAWRRSCRKPRDGHLRVGRRALGQEAQSPPRRHAVGLHVVAADAGGAGGRDHEAGEHPHRGGLAGAVRPEEAEHLAARHVEGDVVDGGEAAESLGQPVDLDQHRLAVGGHAAPPPGSPVGRRNSGISGQCKPPWSGWRRLNLGVGNL